MTQFATIEKRDAAGRLVAKVRVVDGVLDGPCLFFAEDGETVIAETSFRAGSPVVPDGGMPDGRASRMPSMLRPPVAAGDSSF